jgi:pyruvate dehydrogenase E2 component (dihydrolipoamide acetyltransferase)
MTPIVMPQVGQDIERGTVVKWMKRPGDPVRKGELVLVVESEKATFDVEADTDGVLLQQLFAEGEDAKVLEPVGWIGSPGETEPGTTATAGGRPAAAAGPPAPDAAPAATTSAAPAVPPTGRTPSSPSARRTAREMGRTLEGVTGTGPGGRIVRRDVLAAAAPGPRPAARETPPRPPSPPARPRVDEVVPFDRIRKVTAERLSLAARTIPHFFLQRDIDVEDALAWRKAYNARNRCHVSVTDLVCRAAVIALAEYPRLNAHVADDRLTLKASINLGIAVATERGLFVPVIADADRLALRSLAEEARRLAEAARAGIYAPGAAGTFTVTSLGMHGIRSFQPDINPPECAILAVGEAADRVVAIGGMIGVRSTMTVTLAGDHRAVDGAHAAGFLARLAAALGNPADLDPEDEP